MAAVANAQEVLQFWFEELVPEQWFVKSNSLDREIRERFTMTHDAAAKGELFHWRETAEGRLAEIIVLDQFSRNMYRDQMQSFAFDSLALVLAQEAVRQKADKDMPTMRKAFLYMPYMHSESKAVHEQAMKLFDQPGLESNLAFEKKHKAIIDRYGRYPHRNNILGRATTAEEVEFLKGPNSSF